MYERERGLLSDLLQGIDSVFQRTGLPGPCPLPLPEPLQEAINFAEPPKESAGVVQPERLAPISEQISLKSSNSQFLDYKYRYPLKPLSLRAEELMPRDADQFVGYLREDYRQIWQAFAEEMQQIQGWDNFDSYFFTLYFLLKKYFSRVPSVEAPDVSFFDHARVKAAVEDCRYLYQQEKEEREQPITDDVNAVLLIEGQVSGIQNFMYHMVSPQQERARMAKRLRGRSFYLVLLIETVAEYLLKKLNLKIVHQIWCSGGHFLIIAPNIPRVTYYLKACYRDINEFLLRTFRGELGLLLESLAVSIDALTKDFGAMRQQLASGLARGKMRQFSNVLFDADDFQFPSQPSSREMEYFAPVDDALQRLNQIQEEIGRKLTRCNAADSRLAKFHQSGAEIPAETLLVDFEIGEIPISWALNPENEGEADTVYWLNTPNVLLSQGSGKYGFKFITAHVDTYKTPQEVERENPEHAAESGRIGESKGFETMAHAADGGFLGVLRMDADHLGAVFSSGIQPQDIIRAASFSSEIDLFFSGYFQEICRTQFPDNVSVNYCGGDDLVVVGAWNQLVDLACRVREDFKTFTCHNPDITISGGIFPCKGKFPIHQAAQHTKYLLENLAKNNETMEADLDGKITQRNALAIFNHRMPWEDFLELRAIGNDLIHAIHSGKVHRTFLYKLLDLHNTWKTYRQVNTARLYYLMIRNIKETSYRKTLIEKLGSHKYLSHAAYIPMIVGYTGLKVRKNDRSSG